MNFNFYELLKLKKDPFYRPIKNLLKFHPRSLKYYKRAFTHRSSNKRDFVFVKQKIFCIVQVEQTLCSSNGRDFVFIKQ